MTELSGLSTTAIQARLDAVMAARERLWRTAASAADFEGPNASRDVLVSELWRRHGILGLIKDRVA